MIGKPNIHRINNEITIYRMNHPATVTDFMKSIHYGMNLGYQDFNIIWDGESIYPNACVPIAGLIQYYKRIHNISFSFDFPDFCYLGTCGFTDPFQKTVEQIKVEKLPFDKVFEYGNSSQVAELTQAYVNAISRSTECNEGVIEGLIWCINEVMDNVLLHSQADKGFVMAQFHPSSKHIAICVFDYGLGIYNTLKTSKHNPNNSLDAISLAVQEGVGDGKGQGNGLYGLLGIVEDNSGRLTITSGNASIMYSPNYELKKFDHLPYISKESQGTTVDFQLDLTSNVDIKRVFKNIGGFDGFDIRIDNMIQDNDMILYDVYENCSGTATRDAGEQLRNDVVNTLQRAKSCIILDFSNVKTVSSSFIDEFIAKMMLRFGVVDFCNSFKIIGMNQTVKYLCNRSVYMRIHEEWGEMKDSP